MTLSEYIEELHDRLAADPGKRPGQQAFVVLWQRRPDLANRISGTVRDPFYDSERLDVFFEWLATQLEA
jgi:hypothetical protein